MVERSSKAEASGGRSSSTTSLGSTGSQLGQTRADDASPKAKPPEETKSSGDIGVFLCGNTPGLHNLDETKWVEFPEAMVVDSGAAVTVLPKAWFGDYALMESAGSRAGAHYNAANGEPIWNEGEKNLVLSCPDGSNVRQMNFQICDVNKALGLSLPNGAQWQQSCV